MYEEEDWVDDRGFKNKAYCGPLGEESVANFDLVCRSTVPMKMVTMVRFTDDTIGGGHYSSAVGGAATKQMYFK